MKSTLGRYRAKKVYLLLSGGQTRDPGNGRLAIGIAAIFAGVYRHG